MPLIFYATAQMGTDRDETHLFFSGGQITMLAARNQNTTCAYGIDYAVMHCARMKDRDVLFTGPIRVFSVQLLHSHEALTQETQE